jgi:hypothetical protein
MLIDAIYYCHDLPKRTFFHYIYTFAYLFIDPESSTQIAHPRPTTSESILAWELEKESSGCAL